MYTPPLINTEDFANPEFHALNAKPIAKYVDLRVRAIHSHAAFRRVFGAINCHPQYVHEKIQNLEASDAYNDLFEARLKASPVDALLDAKKALHAYLEIANNPMSKEMAKINALREACVIANITAIDDEGRTRLGAALSDFYASLPGANAKREAENAITH